MTIEDFLIAYTKAHPKRATGGIYAMSGFAFQAQVAISRAVQTLVEAADLSRAGQVFVEALSDVAKAQADGQLLLLQVKRTLTASSLNDAAAEMAAIEQVAAASVPPIRPRYGVVCQFSEIDLDWRRLPKASPHQALVQQLWAQGRLEEPQRHADPKWDALAALWTRLRDPFGFYRHALERVISRSADAADALHCWEAIAERFDQHRVTQPAHGNWLGASDFEQDARQQGGQLEVGMQITLARWRALQYMPREAHAQAFRDRAKAMRQHAQANPSSAVPVLWISGPSGAGKSVLLLNVLDELVTQGHGVLWLKPGEVEATLRALIDNPGGAMPDFIAVDDLYDRDARDQLDIGRISILLDEQGPSEWPVLLTCGPTEFAADFEEAARYQGFEVSREDLPLLDETEGRQFSRWVQEAGWQRGASGEAMLQAAQGQGLFVSVATELAVGDLRRFGQRFATRVQAHGDDFAKHLRLCLALNRLYLRAPASWLTVADRARMEDLNRDGDFALEMAQPEEEWLRLTHPHLSNAIYPHLLPAATPRLYAQDLGEAFNMALHGGHEVLAQRLLYAFVVLRKGALAQRMGDVDATHLASLCVAAWKRRVAGGDMRVQANMRVSWACWKVAHRFLLQDEETVIREALVDMEDAESQFRPLGWWPSWWLRLWTVYPKHPELREWATGYLAQTSAEVLPQWSWLWQPLFAATPTEHRAPLVELARQWLTMQGQRGDWHFVWKDLQRAGSLAPAQLAELLAQALPCEEGPHWVHVWEEALQLPPPQGPLCLVCCGKGGIG